MSNKWYRRIVAMSAIAVAGTVVLAAPATADEATVTTDPCNPGTDLGAVFGSLESVPFGSLEQLLGL